MNGDFSRSGREEREKKAVAVPQHARWGGKQSEGEGPASYRGLGQLGCPTFLFGRPQRPSAPTGLVSGPLAPAFSQPSNQGGSNLIQSKETSVMAAKDQSRFIKGRGIDTMDIAGPKEERERLDAKKRKGPKIAI